MKFSDNNIGYTVKEKMLVFCGKSIETSLSIYFQIIMFVKMRILAIEFEVTTSSHSHE